MQSINVLLSSISKICQDIYVQCIVEEHVLSMLAESENSRCKRKNGCLCLFVCTRVGVIPFLSVVPFPIAGML